MYVLCTKQIEEVPHIINLNAPSIFQDHIAQLLQGKSLFPVPQNKKSTHLTEKSLLKTRYDLSFSIF